MNNEFKYFKVLDAKEYVESLGKHCDEFKFKKLNKKTNDEVFVLTRRSFNKLQDKCETEFRINGRIRKRQRKYEEKDCEDKQAENIIGKVTLESDSKDADSKNDDKNLSKTIEVDDDIEITDNATEETPVEEIQNDDDDKHYDLK